MLHFRWNKSVFEVFKDTVTLVSKYCMISLQTRTAQYLKSEMSWIYVLDIIHQNKSGAEDISKHTVYGSYYWRSILYIHKVNNLRNLKTYVDKLKYKEADDSRPGFGYSYSVFISEYSILAHSFSKTWEKYLFLKFAD